MTVRAPEHTGKLPVEVMNIGVGLSRLVGIVMFPVEKERDGEANVTVEAGEGSDITGVEKLIVVGTPKLVAEMETDGADGFAEEMPMDGTEVVGVEMLREGLFKLVDGTVVVGVDTLNEGGLRLVDGIETPDGDTVGEAALIDMVEVEGKGKPPGKENDVDKMLGFRLVEGRATLGDEMLSEVTLELVVGTDGIGKGGKNGGEKLIRLVALVEGLADGKLRVVGGIEGVIFEDSIVRLKLMEGTDRDGTVILSEGKAKLVEGVDTVRFTDRTERLKLVAETEVTLEILALKSDELGTGKDIVGINGGTPVPETDNAVPVSVEDGLVLKIASAEFELDCEVELLDKTGIVGAELGLRIPGLVPNTGKLTLSDETPPEASDVALAERLAPVRGIPMLGSDELVL